jgi:hypothetical protein
MSGAKAALPIWARFTAAVRPSRGYLPFAPPRGIVTQTVDPTTGQIATEACPFKVNEVFAEWQAPTEPCFRHRPGFGQYAAYGPYGQEILIDPVTGEPLYDYQVRQNEEGRIEISNYGYGYGQEPQEDIVPGAEIGALPYVDEPLTDDLSAEPLPEGEWDEDETEVEEESSIEIRPAAPRTLPPAETPEPPPVEVEVETTPVDEAETEAEPTPPELLAPLPPETAEPEATPPPPL